MKLFAKALHFCDGDSVETSARYGAKDLRLSRFTMNTLSKQVPSSQYPKIDDDQVKPVLVAGHKIVCFELKTDYRFEDGTLSELDSIWMRESDVVADCPSSDINRFLLRSHSWQGVPESVWINGRAIKPIPFMEAVTFWAEQAQSPGHQWAALVIRELERLEELVYNVFHGIEIAEEEMWTLTYRDFDGRPAKLSNDPESIAPAMYRPAHSMAL